ncbi:hypothetical protein Ato02nite_094510 [Paractinoplanes toevensis]|uniref:Uncharacterized protein n=1 Tax=Paractinoplanes toevensis TaxID=571911 RepID=A0A919WCP4_9ACTN|nr:hypothetical protein Ato02nite_094510 [Actinoplanes toevensis]
MVGAQRPALMLCYRMRHGSPQIRMPTPARLRHIPVMVTSGEELPVLTIDGANFSDLDGFAREFSTLLCYHTWHGNLDASGPRHRGSGRYRRM